ncbi:hypothetical protein PG985_000694 [Apiospora marii]|uniref:Uncharacterized protein n=1 Tax=Apiospora marii TaxID=335849 RepID=A0ABR1R3J3_9PEZI
MRHVRKNSINTRLLRRPSSSGKTSNGSMAMMGGGSNKRAKSDGFDAPAVAIDHQHYYRYHHATARVVSEPSAHTASPSSSLAGLGSQETPPSSKYKIPFSFTQTGPPTKATGIRRPGPRNQAAAPRVADNRQRQTEHSPGSSRRRPSGTDHREQQTERKSPGGTRRSPREASPPNFSRKTAPSPQQGRSRSNSKTNDVSATVCEVKGENDQSSQDGVFILQAKIYKPSSPGNVATLSKTSSPLLSTSPSTSSDTSSSAHTVSESGPPTSNSTLTDPSSTGETSPSAKPSPVPVEAHLESPYPRNVSRVSTSNGHTPPEALPKKSHASLLDKELPALPATTYEPPVCNKADTKARKKPLTAYNRDPAPKKQEHQRTKRPVNSPLPPKRVPSPAPSAAPPLPAIPNHSQQKAKAVSAAMTVCDAKTVEPENKETLYARRQNKGSSKDSTTSSSTASVTDSAVPARSRPKVDNGTTPIRDGQRAKSPPYSISTNAWVGLQPLNTQREKKTPVYSRSPQPDQNRHGSSSRPFPNQEITTTTNKEFGMFFTIHPENNIIEEVSPSSVQSRIKHALMMAANTAKEEHKREDHEPGDTEANQDAELQKLMQEVDTVFKGLATPRARRGKASPSGRAKVDAAPITAGDVDATNRLLPLSPEDMRRSRRVNPLHLSKELKELQETPRSEPSPRKNTTNERVQKGGSASSTTPRRATPRTPPPPCSSSDQSGISRPGQGSPSKGGREEGKRFDALKRREEFLKYEGGVF